ncbi:MAG: hypothetical protein IPP35_06015 [Elusimicrobia bacterium]|nr:hypothetical protein [Elusimicrobiota bacterium]
MTRSKAHRKVPLEALLALLGSLFAFGPVPGRAALTADLTLTVGIADTFPPNAVPDLAALATVTPGQVVLTWTAPEENGGIFTTSGAVTSYVVKYATFSIASEISLGGSTTTWWNKALTASFPPLVPSAPGTPETPMVIDLAQGTAYWFAVESVDDVGNTSPIDANAASPLLQATAVTGVGDNLFPAPVAGLVVTPTGTGHTVTWPPVTINADGSPISDLASYRVYRSTSLFNFGASSITVANVPLAGPLSFDITTPLVDSYFLIVAVDSTGRESPVAGSNFLQVTPQAFLGQTGLAQDLTYTRVTLPEGLIPELKSAGSDYLLYVEPNTSPLSTQGGTRTQSTYTVGLRQADGSHAPGDFAFSRPEMTVVLNYQGSGGPVDQKKVGVLWWNGTAWVKVSQANVDASNIIPGDVAVSFQTGLPGVYQVRQFEVATELTLDKAGVFPRIFSPNGDGANDVVYFVVQNPNGSSLEGRVIDMSGADVGTLRPGGAGAPTPDSLMWDGRDKSGQIVPAGVYIYQIKGEGKTITGTIVAAH